MKAMPMPLSQKLKQIAVRLRILIFFISLRLKVVMDDGKKKKKNDIWTWRHYCNSPLVIMLGNWK
jgi:hypothetical protein